MKTKTVGRSNLYTQDNGGEAACGGGSHSDRLNDLMRKEAIDDYIKNRMNGCDKDSGLIPCPYDGARSTWIKESNRWRWYFTYTEGPGDKKWMETRDRNYVFRLEREGALDAKEPNLRTEVPWLYEEVMASRQKATEEATKRAVEEEAKRQELNERIMFVVRPLFVMVDQIEVLIRSLNEKVQRLDNKIIEIIQPEIGKLAERMQKLEICNDKSTADVNRKASGSLSVQNTNQNGTNVFSMRS